MCSTATRKYLHRVSSPNGNNNNMFVGNNNGFVHGYSASPSTKQPYVSMQTVVLTFSILLCIFSCLLTVTLSYKWHMDTNRQIDRLVTTVEDIIHDLNTFTDIVREELVAKRVNVYKNQKNKIDDNYDEDLLEEDYSEDKFMGKDLYDNNYPSKISPNAAVAAVAEVEVEVADGDGTTTTQQTPNYRKRRSAEIDVLNVVKNELKNLNNDKSSVDLNNDESNNENLVKPYNRRKAKVLGNTKKNPVTEQDYSYENGKEIITVSAAHFPSDSSKYNSRTHTYYIGNGRLRHPDGDFRDWTQHLWDMNLKNTNYFIFKNGKIEFLMRGLYFVYAQIHYSDQHDHNGYYVMKNDEQMIGCITTRHQANQSDSCYTGGLIHFNTKDVLSIKGLDNHRFILLDPTKSFFGLFKVSQDNEK